MSKVAIREVMESDYDYFALTVREADRKEVEAYGYEDVADALRDSVESSTEAWVATVDGKPAMIFGVDANVLEAAKISEELSIGQAWAIGSEVLFACPKLLHRTSKKMLDMWDWDYDVVICYIWSGNKGHQKWIQRLGFEIDKKSGFVAEDTGEDFWLAVRPAPYLDEE